MTRALLRYRRKLGGVLKTDGRHKKAMEALKLAGQEELRILTEEAFRMLGLSPQILTEVGEAVQRDLRDWQDVHALYTKVRRIAEPRFEIADLKRAAQDVLRDAQGPSDKDTDYLCEIAAKILLAHPDLPSVTIESGRTFHAFDQLQAFREQIFDLTQFHTEHRAAVLARDLYEVLAKIIRNPINDDPAFLEAWQVADGRFERLQKLIYLDASNLGTPTAFAARVCDLTVPEAGERINELREILPGSTFAKFKAGVLDVLLRRLSLDRQPLPETLGLIFSHAEIMVLREIGVRMDRVAELDIERALWEHVRLRDVVSDLVFRRGKGAACALRDIVERAGGPESDLGRIIRRGIFDSLIWGRGPDSVLTFEGGAHIVDLAKVRTVVQHLKRTASWKLLSAEDQALLGGGCHG